MPACSSLRPLSSKKPERGLQPPPAQLGGFQPPGLDMSLPELATVDTHLDHGIDGILEGAVPKAVALNPDLNAPNQGAGCPPPAARLERQQPRPGQHSHVPSKGTPRNRFHGHASLPQIYSVPGDPMRSRKNAKHVPGTSPGIPPIREAATAIYQLQHTDNSGMNVQLSNKLHVRLLCRS